MLQEHRASLKQKARFSDFPHVPQKFSYRDHTGAGELTITIIIIIINDICIAQDHSVANVLC